MKKIFSVLVVLAVGLFVLLPVPVMAAWMDPICKSLTKGSDDWIMAGCGESEGGMVLFDKVPGAVMAVFSVAGIIAAGVIIFGGVRYSMSQGDPGKVKRAKDTIMYAVIGLLVTLMAFAIVNFVLGSIA